MKKRVFPKPGVIVRDPTSKDVLPESGKVVDVTLTYWRRRLKDGDVTAEPSKDSEPKLTEEVSDDGSN